MAYFNSIPNEAANDAMDIDTPDDHFQVKGDEAEDTIMAEADIPLES
ncbi:hypothetical protein SUNI508_11801 [Seiridium unicorne]|uniref:Uncharacterized protein n=1 Tax=Seiridium unicorne TaxID=138068 RepID=A0ABR2UGC1_9PEZI